MTNGLLQFIRMDEFTRCVWVNLWFSVSIHSDYLIRHGCHRVLMDVLHAQQLAGKRKWSPAVADVLSVFVNYGKYT